MTTKEAICFEAILFLGGGGIVITMCDMIPMKGSFLTPLGLSFSRGGIFQLDGFKNYITHAGLFPHKLTYFSFIIQEGSSRTSVNCCIRHYVLHVFNVLGDSLNHCILKSEFLSKQKRTDLQPLASPRVHDSPFSPKLLQVPAREILPLKLRLTKQSTSKALISHSDRGQGHKQKKNPHEIGLYYHW